MDTYAQPPVMATSPARHPFIVMPKSGFFIISQEAAVEVNTAAMAELFVVINMWNISEGF